MSMNLSDLSLLMFSLRSVMVRLNHRHALFGSADFRIPCLISCSITRMKSVNVTLRQSEIMETRFKGVLVHKIHCSCG